MLRFAFPRFPQDSGTFSYFLTLQGKSGQVTLFRRLCLAGFVSRIELHGNRCELIYVGLKSRDLLQIRTVTAPCYLC
jgi:hypothetical protein